MPAKRARMKAGHRPIIIDCAFVPEHPAYWTVPESASAAVALHVEDGQVEYEPHFARAPGGQFAYVPAPALAVEAPPTPVAPGGKKGKR